MNKQRTLNAVLRTDLASFIQKTFARIRPGEFYVHNWHIDAMAWALMQCYEGRIKRLIITLPPRNLKSIVTSVAFPAWVLGHDPTRKIIGVSYADALANRHAFDTRTVMDSGWYRNCFPGTRPHPRKNTANEYVSTRQGFRLATSIGGTLTGRGGNIIIIDDPHKPEEALSNTRRPAVIDWCRTTLFSRLDNKGNDVIIVIQQRLHEEDLAGYLLEQGGWVHLNIPAIAEETQRIPIGPGKVHIRQPGDCLDPQREPLAVLDKIKAEIGSYTFAAQYQQQPAPSGGGILKWEWFQRYEHQPEQVGYDELVISWDTANKAADYHDYSVGTVWLLKGKHYYLLQVIRERLEFPDLQRRIIAVSKHWKANCTLIEDKAAGTQLIQDLHSNGNLCIVGITPKEDKATRAMSISPIIEGKQVFLPREASWLADFQREVVHFPKGKYDDQVDSLTQFLEWARGRVKCEDLDFNWAVGSKPAAFYEYWACDHSPSPWDL